MNLYDAVTQNGCIRRLGELTVISLAQGYGGLVVPSMDFMTIRKWAQRRNSTDNMQRDVAQFLEPFEVMVARVGSALLTKGATSRLVRIAGDIKSAGLSIEDWALPKRVLEELKAPEEEPAAETTQDPYADAPSDYVIQPDTSIPFDLELQRAMAMLGLELSKSV